MTDHMDRGMLQDRLIDLVHETGSADARAALERQIAADPDLVEELAFLRQARMALRATPAVDVDRIVASLPASRTRSASMPRLRSWQWAAALATVALGGISLAVVERSFTGQANGDLARGVAETTLVAAADAPLGVTFGQGLSEFDEDELDALFTELERFDGLPSLEPARPSALATAQEGGN
jgi:anti-sigma factor RsiW